jgi:diadenylate cyclase
MMDMLQSVEITDIVDVAIVAALIYVGLIWLKRSRGFLIFLGIVILGMVYALARFLNLFLTTAILQGFFAVLLIAIIVIFQEDLRHFFERIALWGLGRQRPNVATPIVELVVRTCLELMKRREGALIVLVGKDPVERHVEGGFALDGRPSAELLLSIFEPTTPGHDGAVIMEDGKIARFACHLPLSKDLDRISGMGTRHAAALGLSERCDALCVVVSEERGAVSVARDGDLRQLGEVSKLGPAINDFLREKFPPRSRRRIAGFINVNKREKFAALLLSIAMWLVFAQGAGLMQRDFVVPVEYANIPAGLVVEKAMPRRLSVTLSGEERSFKLLEPEDLKVTVDLSGVSAGRQAIGVTGRDVTRIPRGLSVKELRPSEVGITVVPSAREE